MNIKKRFLLLLACINFSNLHSSCGDIASSFNFIPPNVQSQAFNLPPQFTNVKVDCNTNTNDLCVTSLNVTDSTVVLDTTTAGEFTNLNDYNFLRANRSIFPTFDNELLITPTYVGITLFGIAVAISGDGSTLAIGATRSRDTSIAAVDIYRRLGNTWRLSQHINRPFATTYGFGGAVSLSYDGSILAVGSADDFSGDLFNLTNVSVACVALYEYDHISNLYIPIQVIKGSSVTSFGASVALSATGQYLVFNESIRPLSGVNLEFRVGPAAYVYVRSIACNGSCTNQTAWELQAYLTAVETNGTIVRIRPGAGSPGSQRVAISADGSTMALGIPSRLDVASSLDIGAVAIFKRYGSTWQQTQLITDPSVSDGGFFGVSVALSGDGQYVAISQNTDASALFSYAYIFALRGTSYVREATLTVANLTLSQDSGPVVSLSEDGTVLAIGTGALKTSLISPTAGIIAVALRGPNNTWSMPFVRSTPAINDAIGYSIGCSADGAFIIAGAAATNVSVGAAYVWRPTGSCIPNDTVVTGSLCVYKRTTIDSTLRVKGNVHLNGTIVTGTAGHVNTCTTNLAATLSDNRMKTDVTTLSPEDALAKLRELKPVEFAFSKNPSSQQKGFIADEIKNAFAHWVGTRPALGDEVQFIDDGNVKTILIRAEVYAYLIAALERLVERNNKRNEELKDLLARSQARLPHRAVSS